MLKGMHTLVCSRGCQRKEILGCHTQCLSLTICYLSSPCTLTPQVRWNEPGAHYALVEKEKLPRFPFSIDQEGDIYVTQPLDREEKDSVSKTGRECLQRQGQVLCSPRERRAEKILLHTINQNPKPQMTDFKTWYYPHKSDSFFFSY